MELNMRRIVEASHSSQIGSVGKEAGWEIYARFGVKVDRHSLRIWRKSQGHQKRTVVGIEGAAKVIEVGQCPIVNASPKLSVGKEV